MVGWEVIPRPGVRQRGNVTLGVARNRVEEDDQGVSLWRLGVRVLALGQELWLLEEGGAGGVAKSLKEVLLVKGEESAISLDLLD